MKRQKANKKIQNVVGNNCCNCGETDHIEYHHIVPLALGGNDIESNIVPLCHVCHMAAHHGRNINHYFGSFNKGGRHSIATIEYNSNIFDMYINGEIGNRMAKQMLGYSDSTQIKDRPVFKRYIKSKGINTVKNIIDVAATNKSDGLKNGDVVGEIIYEDGRHEDIIYKDTGHNLVEYHHRCS